jgi:large subunit ribosomal protein L30e
MAKKKLIVNEDLKELKSKLQEGKVILGTDRVMKALRNSATQKVFLASNTTEKTKEDVNHYANLSEVKIVNLELDNEELGVFCKKNFFISVLAIEE